MRAGGAHRALTAAVLFAALAACDEPRGMASTGAGTASSASSSPAVVAPSAAPPASAAAPAPSALAAASPSDAGIDSDAAAAPPTASSVAAIDGGVDAGAPVETTPACRPVASPRQLSMTGPMTFGPPGAQADEPPHVVFNRDGAPERARLAPPKTGPDVAARAKSELAFAAERASPTPCAIARDRAYCLAPSGSLRRSSVTGEGSETVTLARPGTPVAAAPIGERGVVLAFLADERTTEGHIMSAYAKLDDALPVRLSDDGSGATSLSLAPTGDRVLAAYVDERRAMTPVHARLLALTPTGGLDLGRDAVVFVGEGALYGGSLRAIVAGAAQAPKLLLLGTHFEGGFGMGAVRLEDVPRDDSPVEWNPYPGAMTRAPIASAAFAAVTFALRNRTAAGGGHLLELVELDPSGKVARACVVDRGVYTDLAIAAQSDAPWIAYTRQEKSWIERVRMP